MDKIIEVLNRKREYLSIEVTENEHGQFAVALVIDGWYSSAEAANDMADYFAEDLEDIDVRHASTKTERKVATHD